MRLIEIIALVMKMLQGLSLLRVEIALEDVDDDHKHNNNDEIQQYNKAHINTATTMTTIQQQHDKGAVER